MELKDFCIELGQMSERYVFRPSAWSEIESIIPALKLFAEKMNDLQAEVLTLSDMYGIWFDLKLSLKELPGSDFIDRMLMNLNARESKLFDSPVLFACVYLDPRLRTLLTPQQKDDAINHLRKLFLKLNPRRSQMDQNETNTEFDGYCNEAGSMVALNKHLNELDNQRSLTDNSLNDDINSEIEIYAKISREPMTKNIITLWRKMKKNFPILFSLSEIVMSVSPTEVGVERNFSRLKFAFNRLRTNLNDEELEKIMFITLNHKK